MAYAIGTKYLTTNGTNRVCTVSDIHTTSNHAGEVVRVRYVSTHEFLGQTITERDVCEVTIAKGISFLSTTKEGL